MVSMHATPLMNFLEHPTATMKPFMILMYAKAKKNMDYGTKGRHFMDIFSFCIKETYKTCKIHNPINTKICHGKFISHSVVRNLLKNNSPVLIKTDKRLYKKFKPLSAL